MKDRGWDCCDFILITPDAYVDHPSFAMALISRFLESHGYRVGIISQPRWQDPDSFLQLGIPRIAFGISGGNVDSMVMNYTPSLKRRNSDAYCENNNPFFPGTERSVKNRIRPDRTTIVYCNQLKSLCRQKPIIIGGVEASLRRFAHFDYWSGKVRRSILFDCRADILVYGMGEYVLLEVLKYLESGHHIEDMKINQTAIIKKDINNIKDAVILPSYNDVCNNKGDFADAFNLINKYGESRPVAQKQDSRYLLSFPPAEISGNDLDSLYDLPYMRKPHPRYREIPAFEMIKQSITILRGCYGNCSFCSISSHQGTRIISRSSDSIIKEIEKLVKMDYFDGFISDLGGPCPNMYFSECCSENCINKNCLQNGSLCKSMQSGTDKFIDLIKRVKSMPSIKRISISSGLRVEKELYPIELHEFIIKYMNVGQLKIAPESGSDRVLKIMNKSPVKCFDDFIETFSRIKTKTGKKIRLYPYFIIGHPGEDESALEETLMFIKKHGLISNNCQQFTPTPMTLSTAIYYLGYNPLTGEEIPTQKDNKRLSMWKEGVRLQYIHIRGSIFS